MSWGNDVMKRKAVVAVATGCVAAAALAWSGVAMAQAVVVRSTGPSAAQFPTGRKLAASSSVSLRAGDQITMIDKSGTRVLKGPGNFPVTAAVSRDQAGALAVANMVNTAGRARVRTGAVRGGPVETPPAASGPDSIWYLDVTKGGTFCTPDLAQVVLWRPDSVETGMGKLVGPDGTAADVMWNAGNPLKMWPSESLPLADGKVYNFRNPVGATVAITVKLLAAVPDDVVDMAGLLAEKGCASQLDVLANTSVGG